MNIAIRITAKRGCGYRKPGGLYVVSGVSALSPCCKLLNVLNVCPCCGSGIKPTRGWQWIDADAIFGGTVCTAGNEGSRIEGYASMVCPLNGKIGRAGLLWIGESFYPTVEDFEKEAAAQGISRRIKALPKDYKPGETWVLLAHRLGVKRAVVLEGEPTYDKAIFRIFKPSAVEYVVKGDETEEKLSKLVERGITPVKDELPQSEMPFATTSP